jgi:MFS superfamily sulfate permease-like transporter
MTAFAVGASTLALILLLKPFRRIPGILLAVLAATLAAGALDLATTAGVKVLGPLPRGLPHFSLPWTQWSDLGPVIIGGCAVALISFADTSVLSRAYAVKTRRTVNPNQEVIGLGRPIWRRDSSRDSRSAAALHALRSLRPREPRPSSRASSAPWRWPC